MRFLLYNIRYATGTGAAFHLPVPGAGYLRSDKRVLAGITRFIKAQDPDIVGLIQIDTASLRTRNVNQAEVIAQGMPDELKRGRRGEPPHATLELAFIAMIETQRRLEAERA